MKKRQTLLEELDEMWGVVNQWETPKQFKGRKFTQDQCRGAYAVLAIVISRLKTIEKRRKKIGLK